ncbi:MAG TPA: hypothetical protein VFM96_04590 [Gaiellaceae bacterium]|nr:hypothetical protein [Gaiellaceae bacterium]
MLERLEVGAPDEPLLQFPEPAFDEGLRFGVAVAAAAVGDAVLGESFAEAAACESGSVVGAERQLAALDATRGDGAAAVSVKLAARARPSSMVDMSGS